MWTYAREYKPLLPSSERIAYHAETELYQSLNKDRLIAFIGSGVALPYGRLTWAELCALLIMDVDSEFWKKLKHYRRKYQGISYSGISGSMMKEAKFLHCTLRSVLGEKKIYEDEIEEYYKEVTFFDGGTIDDQTEDDQPKDSSYLLAPTIDNPVSTDTTVLELCSKLATILSSFDEKNQDQIAETNFIKAKAAKYLTENTLKQFESRLKLLNGYGRDSIYRAWMDLTKDKDITSIKNNTFEEMLVSIMEDEKLLKVISSGEFKNQWLSKDKNSLRRSAIEVLPWCLMREHLEQPKVNKPIKGDENNKTLNNLFHDLYLILSLASMTDAKIDQGDWSDPIKTIVDDLKIHRLVTLNYDTELEKYFLRQKAYQAEENDHLLMSTKKVKSRRVAEPRNALGAKFISITPKEKNLVGKLLQFAVSSKRNHSYIFHLHGRGDCADGLILTEYDYQELYVRSSASRRAFSEGIDTLFSGDDILFLGGGMNESDLLKPLRQFVSESQDISLRHHCILALLSKDNNSQRTEEQALKLHTKFGVKSMFYDSKTNDIDKEINELKKECANESKLSKKEFERLNLQLSLMELSRQKVGEQSAAFDKKLKYLAEKQQEWWKDWRELPGKRVAKYIDWQSDTNDANKHPRLWIKQKICLLSTDGNATAIKPKESEKLIPILQEIIDRIENDGKIVNDDSSELRGIHRYAGSIGVGKDTIVHFLQRYCQEEISADQYLGCFFADAKFSTEYTSVISALSRFLAGIIADQIWDGKNTYSSNQLLTDIKANENSSFEGYDKSDIEKIVALNGRLTYRAKKSYGDKTGFKKAAEEEKTFNRQWVGDYLGIDLPSGKTRILHTYLNYFSTDNNISGYYRLPRILVCLSGLDRLVDKNGYAFNALHRSFFKVLTSPENKKVPLTLLLFSDRPEIPIRYLSEFENKWKKLGGYKEAKNKERIAWDSQKAKLKRWSLIPKSEINERYWLPRCLIDNLKDQRKITKLEYSQINDEKLGIYSFQGEELVERKSLRDIAYNYMSVHFWLRLLLCQIQFKLNEGLLKKHEAKIILDSLDLAASRNGISGVIDQLLNVYDQFDTDPKAKRFLSGYQAILSHLALFTIPVERAVLVNCPEVVEAIYDNNKPRSEEKTANHIEGYLQTLNKIGLIIKIERNGIVDSSSSESNGKSDEQDYRYTLASIMRQHLLKKMDFSACIYGEFSFFDVSLYPTQPLDIPSPKERDFIFIGQILQTMIANARLNLTLSKERSNLDSQHSISRIIRAAVNLVNGSFSIGVVSRLEKADLDNIEFCCGHAQPFEAYNRWLRCLSNIAVAIEAKVIEKALPVQKPLYETESAWLFNEQALVNLIQGRVFDALHLFRLAKQRLNNTPWVNTDDVESYTSLTSLRRVELNYAIAMLESGMLKEAEIEFYRLYSQVESNQKSLTAYLSCGYLGYCYFLRGYDDKAKKYYIDALDFCTSNNYGLREVAIFYSFYADLIMMSDNYREAEIVLNKAMNAAMSGKHVDIYYYLCISKVKILLEKSNHRITSEINDLWDMASSYADKMGLIKIRIYADIVRGEALALVPSGQVIAEKTLQNAIMVTHKYGLGLLNIFAYEAYQKVLIRKGADKDASSDLSYTLRKLSTKTGYFNKERFGMTNVHNNNQQYLTISDSNLVGSNSVNIQGDIRNSIINSNAIGQTLIKELSKLSAEFGLSASEVEEVKKAKIAVNDMVIEPDKDKKKSHFEKAKNLISNLKVFDAGVDLAKEYSPAITRLVSVVSEKMTELSDLLSSF